MIFKISVRMLFELAPEIQLVVFGLTYDRLQSVLRSVGDIDGNQNLNFELKFKKFQNLVDDFERTGLFCNFKSNSNLLTFRNHE